MPLSANQLAASKIRVIIAPASFPRCEVELLISPNSSPMCADVVMTAVSQATPPVGVGISPAAAETSTH